jgi:hypothetical protein
MITLEQVYKTQDELFKQARNIIEKKGHDYNRSQQEKGDTLFNMRVAKLLGIVDSDTQSVLVRLSDKFMRLNSLTKDPKVSVSVKDESVRDTIVDVMNYVTYLYLFYEEEKNSKAGVNL